MGAPDNGKSVRGVRQVWCLGLAALVGVATGLASAFFLFALDAVTSARAVHPGLIFLLPVAGVAIGYVYHHYGKDSARGTNLLLDTIHDPEKAIPSRMAPLVLVTTLITHLFGGSAGREGTAVQVGGAIADLAVKPANLEAEERRILIMSGIAAGFGSVFGTPWAGAIFGLEVFKGVRVRWMAVLPCLVASFVGDLVCRRVGIVHHGYHAATSMAWSWPLVGLILLSGGLFALASTIFVEITHEVQKLGQSLPGAAYFRPFIGGCVIVAMTLLIGSQDFNGLGIPLIDRSFSPDLMPYGGFAVKILLTAVTIGSGFKGGEVTPLFCIGALLGHDFAQFTHQDPSLFAALGFVAVFAAASNTPLACAIMGVELFGPQIGAPLLLCCLLAAWLSGRRGIYPAQYPN